MATYEQVLPAFDAGFTLMTHLYCAMSGITKVNSERFAGVIESAFLIDGMDVEIIADERHIPASLLKYVTKFKPTDCIVLCTDSMRGIGTKEDIKNGFEIIIDDQVAKILTRVIVPEVYVHRLVRTMIVQLPMPLEWLPPSLPGFVRRIEKV